MFLELRVSLSIAVRVFFRYWSVLGLPFFGACGVAIRRSSLVPAMIGLGVTVLLGVAVYLYIVISIVHISKTVHKCKGW